MKNIVAKISVIALAILLWGFNASAQSKSEIRVRAVEGLYTLESGKVTLTRIIEVSGKSTSEIFSLVQATLKNDAIGARYYIQSADDVNNAINAEGYYQAYYKKKPTSKRGQTVQVENTLQVDIQDGRVRIIMTLDNYVNDMIKAIAVSSVYPINDKTNNGKMIIGNQYSDKPSGAMLKTDASKYFNAAINTGVQVLDSIENQLKKDNCNW